MPNPFAHVELSTDDVKKAKKFYLSVFSWKLNDLPAVGYTMIDVSGGVGGGMQKKPMPEAPNAWLPYVQVDDVKATLAKATKAGGQIVLDFQSIGEMGAIGIFTDPAGATLGVWESSGAPPSPPAAEPAPKPAKKASAKKAAPEPPPPAAKKASAKKAPAKKAAPEPAPAASKKASKKAAPPPPPPKKASKKAAPPPPPAPAKKAPAKKAPAKKK
jgi:predicted enzyme related to lactoylglutathione lyase